MSGPERDWPPLIVAENIPRAVRWRDILLTLIAWAAFVALLDEELSLSLRALRAIGFARADGAAHAPLEAERLIPFLFASAVLPVLLVYFSLRTLRRRSQSLLLPASAPLDIAEQACGAGIDERALAEARDQPIVVFHNEDCGIRIDARSETRAS